jgi:predicted metal-binding membrane protein
VKRSIMLSRILAVFLIAGLFIAPLSASLAALADGSAPAMKMNGEMAMGDMDMSGMDMTGDMPCCPDNKAPVDCDKCALMAICMNQTLQALPSYVFTEIVPSTMRTLVPPSDPKMESLGHSPPPRPPRSLVRSA